MIDQVLALGEDDPLAGLVDPGRIAAAGHSDGEVIAFGVGFLECCRDPRVKSVIAMAGDLANANNPHVRDTGTPILHIMELDDEYDPYPHSIQWDRDNLTAPRWMVSLNSSHVPPYTQPGDPAFELVGSVTVAFLDGTLKGDAERLDDVASLVVARAGGRRDRALTTVVSRRGRPCTWRRRILPVAVWGTSSVTTTSSGVLSEPMRVRTHSRTCSVSISSTPARSEIIAAIFSPHSSSARPTTAATEMASCCRSASSISAGAMFSPPRMIVSSARPSQNR